MPILARSDEPKVNQFQINAQIKNAKSFDTETFVIPLAFACLREAASAKAGILTLGFQFSQ
jgi:hypothetical protein